MGEAARTPVPDLEALLLAAIAVNLRTQEMIAQAAAAACPDGLRAALKTAADRCESLEAAIRGAGLQEFFAPLPGPVPVPRPRPPFLRVV